VSGGPDDSTAGRVRRREISIRMIRFVACREQCAVQERAMFTVDGNRSGRSERTYRAGWSCRRTGRFRSSGPRSATRAWTPRWIGWTVCGTRSPTGRAWRPSC
jgi:hypothetical protein